MPNVCCVTMTLWICGYGTFKSVALAYRRETKQYKHGDVTYNMLKFSEPDHNC